jgi:hypothetical protein
MTTPPSQIVSIMGIRDSSHMDILSIIVTELSDFTRMICSVNSVTGLSPGSIIMNVDNTDMTIIQKAMDEMVYRT